jgi:hypothetical protein
MTHIDAKGVAHPQQCHYRGCGLIALDLGDEPLVTPAASATCCVVRPRTRRPQPAPELRRRAG